MFDHEIEGSDEQDPDVPDPQGHDPQQHRPHGTPRRFRGFSQPRRPRAVAVLGDRATMGYLDGPLPASAAAHGMIIADAIGFDDGALDGATVATGHERVAHALTTCLENGYSLWLPFPGDVGGPRAYLGLLGTAAALGIAVFVDGPHPVPWRRTILPGVSVADAVAAVAESLQAFLATAGGDLLVGALIDTLREADAAPGEAA